MTYPSPSDDIFGNRSRAALASAQRAKCPPTQNVCCPFPSVRDTAALRTLDNQHFTEGEIVYVESVRDYFGWTSEVLTPREAVVVDSVGPSGGSYTRLEIPNYTWRLQTDWFVDGTSGNDENEGNAQNAPIKTWGELVRRLGEVYILDNDSPVLTNIRVEGTQPPFDELVWEVKNGSDNLNRRVAIRTSLVLGNSYVADANTQPYDQTTADPGHADAVGGFAYPLTQYLAFFPNLGGLEAISIVTETIDDDNGRFGCPMRDAPTGIVTAPKVATGDGFSRFFPVDSRIRQIVSDGTAYVTGCQVSQGRMTAVKLYGCLLSDTELEGCTIVSCISSARYLGDTSPWASIVMSENLGKMTPQTACLFRSLVNRGGIEAQSGSVVMTAAGSLINWGEVNTTALGFFGGGGAFATNPGSYKGMPGSALLQPSFAAPPNAAAGMNIVGVNTIEFAPAAPQVCPVLAFATAPLTDWSMLAAAPFTPQQCAVERMTNAIISTGN